MRLLLRSVLFASLAGALPGVPVIDEVRHDPIVPGPDEPFEVTARVTGGSAVLRWRIDGNAGFATVPMADDDGDGRVAAMIPGHADLSVGEFFIDATDGTTLQTWPAGAIGAIWQTDGSWAGGPWAPGSRPEYRVVVRAADRTVLVDSPAGGEVTGTLVTADGTGMQARHGCALSSEAAGSPRSFRVRFPAGEPWHGRRGFSLAARFPHAQVIGSAVCRSAGLPVGEAVPVLLRVNGIDLAEAGPRMFGTYARVEAIDSDWAARQFPLDLAGSLYRVDDSGPGTHGELAYETPATPANYAESYLPLTSSTPTDFHDVIALTASLTQAPDAGYRTELDSVLDSSQWIRFLALDTLLGNVRPGLQSGRATGFSLYRGDPDGRFLMVPGATDTILGVGENGTGDPVTRSLYGYDGVQGLNRLMNHPDILPDFHATLLELMDSVLAPGAIDPLIDQWIGDWVEDVTVQQMKDFVVARLSHVRAQIPRAYSMVLSTTAPDIEGMKQTVDGNVAVSGMFDTARIRSIRVNSQPAVVHYRQNGPHAAGSWQCELTGATGGLRRGMNIVRVRFFEGPGGTGEIVHELQADLYWSGGPETLVSGTIGTSNRVALLHYGVFSTSTPGSVWKYLTDGTNPGPNWKLEGFDDTGWSEAQTQIGYGDNPRDEQTLVPRVEGVATHYFRGTFTVPDGAAFSGFIGEVKYDDGAAVYVNGFEVLRTPNLAPDAGHFDWADFGGAPTTENATTGFTVPATLVNGGVNTIAVEVHQHDAASGDMSFDLKLDGVLTTTSEVRWTAAGSPYRLTGDATVPNGAMLVIEPGVTVFADHTRRLTVNGIMRVIGSEEAPVWFSHRPGAPLVDDPRLPGVQALPPKWGGILFVDSLSSQNLVSHARFVNAQPAAVEGCITVIRSECLVEHCLFTGTHLHGVYGRNCSLTVQDSVFPDVFAADDDPVELGLDNLSEFVEVDSPPNDPGVAGRPEFIDGFPAGGHLRLYRNVFFGSRGHNDLVDVTAGKWGLTPVLDVQDNWFRGPSGDEHIDLNGDCYAAGNRFERCTKDEVTSDHGYANAISSDVGASSAPGEPNTTVVVARNVFTRLDHAVNIKRGTGVIFEHNTVADINQDYPFVRGTFNQNVKTSAINCFIPDDDGPEPGDGGYAAFNVFFGSLPVAGGTPGPFPRIFGWADLDVPEEPPHTTVIGMAHNFLDPAMLDPVVGSQHPENVFAAVWQPRIGDPLFVDRAGMDFSLQPHSPARGTAPFGLDYGATIPSGCYLGNLPPAVTPATSANIVVGGPGIFSFQWRLDVGAWSPVVTIAPAEFPRTGPTLRTATLALENLGAGAHQLEVIGQDFAGNWQSNPTVATWMVDPNLRRVLVEEIIVRRSPVDDLVELRNSGAMMVSLAGWSLSDGPTGAGAQPLSGTIGPGEIRVIEAAAFDLDPAGGRLFLRDATMVVDSIQFGPQPAGYSLSRVGRSGEWMLGAPTPGAVNVAVMTGPTGGLRLNEWLAAPDSRFEAGWLEIVNTGTLPVALEGVRVSDNLAGRPSAHVFPPHSFIGPGSVLKLDATADSGPGAGQVPFDLDPQGGFLSIAGSDGQSLDRVAFGPQSTGVSMGRDAFGSLAFFPGPTGGFPNDAVEPGGYPGWLEWHATVHGVDDDADGLESLVEFALGLDPRRPDAATGEPLASRDINGRLAIHLRLPANPVAAGGYGRDECTVVVQGSDTLTSAEWVTLAAKSPSTGWVGPGAVTAGPNAGGFVPVTVRDSTTAPVGSRRFMRLRFSWSP